MNDVAQKIEQVDAGMGGQVICPRCGFDTRQAKLEVLESDRQEYIRALLGNRPFVKVYSLFDGQLKVTLQDMTSDASTKLAGMFDAMPKGTTYILNAVQLKLLFSCAGYVLGDKEVKLDTSKVDTLDAALAEYGKHFGGLSETVCGMIINQYNAFTRLLTSIASGGLDKNF